jgi:hypothetical protein
MHANRFSKGRVEHLSKGDPTTEVRLVALASDTLTERSMNQDDKTYSFCCPNLNCEAQYVAIRKDRAPDKKPRCIECDTPFLAKYRGHFLHYQSLRFD